MDNLLIWTDNNTVHLFLYLNVLKYEEQELFFIIFTLIFVILFLF